MTRVKLLYFFLAGVAGTVEVHFENKDGGFFLKHTPRQYYPAVADLAGAAGGMGTPPGSRGGTLPGTSTPGSSSSGASSSVLSVDRFTVFQTSQPISIRATYGPFSTKQTVPARYIVPDPLDSLPLPEKPQLHTTNSTATTSILLDMDLTASASHHLDMSAHIVRSEIPRDSPVLRVLFHTGSDPGGRRQLLLRNHQRVCIVLHATLGERPALTAACSPDGEDGVCLAQVTIPATWWAPLPPPDNTGRAKPVKTPQRLVQVAYSVLEPRTGTDGDGKDDGGCIPRVQIQPMTPLAAVPLVPARSAYRELRSDDLLTMMVPHAPLYPLSRLHIPVFLHPRPEYPISVFIIRARVKSGLRLLGADASTDQWNVSVDLNPRHTVATATAIRRENNADQQAGQQKPLPRVEEVFSWLLEVVEDSSDLWDGGRIVWSVRYVLEGADSASSFMRGGGNVRQLHGGHGHHAQSGTQHRPLRDGILEETRRKLTARLEIQKDDIQSVLPISKNWDVINTAVLTGRQVSQAMKVFIVSQAGKVADVTLQSSCHSEDESVLKVSSSCSSVYVDGSEIRGSSNASVLVKYGTYTGLAKFTVWMPEFPLEVNVADFRLSQVKGWKVPEEHASGAKIKRSIDDSHSSRPGTYRGWPNTGAMLPEDVGNGIDQERHTTCRLRFQQSPVEVYARFLATDHDSGRVSYFVSRRTWLRVTDLVLSLLRVSDPRIASLHGCILQGRSMGRTEVQVLSPITGRVIGAKEVRVGNDKVSITRLQVRVVSGLQLSIVPDNAVENGYIAETSVTRKLTAQYQEGLLDIDLEFSDGSRTPLRDVAVSDYYLLVDSLDPEVVAFAPMVASHHPRVIAVGEGRGDLLRVALLLAEECRGSTTTRRGGGNTGPSKGGGKGNVGGPLAAASAHVDVDFSASEVPQRPDFVQNDGGGNVGSGHGSRERKNNREMTADLRDILKGIPLKDENNHEPTVQARQHHSAVANGIASGVGMRPHNNMHMTPLEIGMYVLLAAFCFAIVVFVVSCVVYASKFKPQTIESAGGNTSGGSSGLQSLGAAVSKVTGGSGIGSIGLGGTGHLGSKKQPRESTTNAHDWVWLGRATLERASGHVVVGENSSSGRTPSVCNNNNNISGKDQQLQMRITANPMSYSAAENMENEQQSLGTCFDNPNHIDLPSRPPAIDSSTYCKKEKIPSRHHNPPPPPTPKQHHKAPHINKDSAADKLWQITPPPPPLPPHGIPLEKQQPQQQQHHHGESTESSEGEYKPPVPPHRNIGVTARIGPSRQPGPMPGFLPQHQQSPPPPPPPSQQQLPETGIARVTIDQRVNALPTTIVAPTPAPPRRHHHHHHHHRNINNHRNGKSSSSGHHHAADSVAPPKPPDHLPEEANSRQKNYNQELSNLQQLRYHHSKEDAAKNQQPKRQSKDGTYITSREDEDDEEDALPDPAFVEFPTEGVMACGGVQRRGNSPEVKRATIVGNPMFSATEYDGDAEDFRVREELLGLEDLNLGMDYDQIMEYFDNLKESNA
ncbi:transmembrane protein 132E [Periplaneta americana]|uniref:transmembrane protein 132E n=1 Tax=Periplaneta americana TaxID=6978 RepID=UPI0037E880ED